jgi:hypothetical protein
LINTAKTGRRFNLSLKEGPFAKFGLMPRSFLKELALLKYRSMKERQNYYKLSKLWRKKNSFRKK